jgi:hypothetical protein
MKIKKEFSFVLPDAVSDTLKIKGTMRLVKVKDLMEVQRDSRVAENPSYFYVVLLSRIISSLDNHKVINTKIIENMSTRNFAFLLDFMNSINHNILNRFAIRCEECGTLYQGERRLAGEL